MQTQACYKIPKNVSGPPGAFIWIEVNQQQMVSWVMRHTDKAVAIVKRQGGPLAALILAKDKIKTYRGLRAPSTLVDQKAFEVQALNQWLEYGEKAFRRFFRDETEKMCLTAKASVIVSGDIEAMELADAHRRRRAR